MHAELHPDANRELNTGAHFYERRMFGLGDRFVDEVHRGIGLLLERPRIGQRLDNDLRHFVLNDFPFSLIYRLEPERIWVVAIAHHSRRPGYWRERSGP